MAREREGFFDGYDPTELARETPVVLSNRELLLVRMALDVLLRETSRHDHLYKDLHGLLSKLPTAPERVPPTAATPQR